MICVNTCSILAILSHESYGFWALPSLYAIFFLSESKYSLIPLRALLRSIINLLPSISAFLICIIFKGSAETPLAIHKSWQQFASLLPSFGVHPGAQPIGAIEAIGWTTKQGLELSFSTLNDFSYLIWIPAAWMATIYVCINSFIGRDITQETETKRLIIFFQFAGVTPLFILGCDFGRWIFIWLTSAALLYGYMSSSSGHNITRLCSPKVSNVINILAPGFSLHGTRKYELLFFGIPPCCWTLQNFLVTTPLWYGFSSARFILGMARKTLSLTFAILTLPPYL